MQPAVWSGKGGVELTDSPGILLRLLTADLRSHVLQVMRVTYKTSLAIGFAQQQLCFDNKTECLQFLRKRGFVVTDTHVHWQTNQ
jgi:hypothetical protein